MSTSFVTVNAGGGFVPEALMEQLKPSVLNKIAGQAVTQLVIKHLTGYDRGHPNKLGGKRTHFIRDMARNTNLRKADDSEAIVSISHIGARLRILGGTVLPGKGTSFISGKPTRALTIPANAEAYGSGAKKFADKLSAVYFNPARGHLVGMLLERLKPKGERRGKAKNAKPRVMFWLVDQATIKPNPGLLPPTEEMQRVSIEAQRKLVMRLMKSRAGKGGITWDN
jgi:hypothetical protein